MESPAYVSKWFTFAASALIQVWKEHSMQPVQHAGLRCNCCACGAGSHPGQSCCLAEPANGLDITLHTVHQPRSCRQHAKPHMQSSCSGNLAPMRAARCTPGVFWSVLQLQHLCTYHEGRARAHPDAGGRRHACLCGRHVVCTPPHTDSAAVLWRAARAATSTRSSLLTSVRAQQPAH